MWRPIETAPKDGTAVWVWYEGQAYLAYCEPADPPLRPDECWFLKASFKRKANRYGDDIYGCYAHSVKPTLWRPLPQPPAD